MGPDSLGESQMFGPNVADPAMSDMAPGEANTAAPDPLDFHGYTNYRDSQYGLDDTQQPCDCRPALTESTGTWLRRGWWYTEIDAVVMNRMWKRDDQTIAFENGTNRRLQNHRTAPGASGSARLTLGRFLFRDTRNRDHTLEFTAFGGGEWSQHDTMTSASGNQTLFVPTSISDGNLSFDGSQTMGVTYDSRFKSFELNYRVKERMRRDRMVHLPNGEWVRRANEGLTKQYLIGFRYFDMDDIFDWNATNINTFGGSDGRYLIDTNNDMFGLQLGCSLLLEHDRWNIETYTKGGVFLNDAKAASNLTIDNDPANANSFAVYNRESTFSFVGELRMIGRYHIRPHLSLRAGWQMMYVSSVALAPDQLTFSPDDGRFSYTGDPFFNGGLFGFEGYW